MARVRPKGCEPEPMRFFTSWDKATSRLGFAVHRRNGLGLRHLFCRMGRVSMSGHQRWSICVYAFPVKEVCEQI